MVEAMDKSTLKMLKTAFDGFDQEKKGSISNDMVGPILEMLGQHISAKELEEIIKEVDEDQSGEMEFEEFAKLASRFLTEEEEDIEAIKLELKEAFRLYDREGNGFITTEVLREILSELDEKITPADLDEMIDEIDADGSGTIDWDEFLAVMTG